MGIQRGYVRAVAAMFLCHAAILAFVHSPVATSNILLEMITLVAAAACYRRSSLCSGDVRWKWILAALGVLTWSAGQGIILYNEGLLKLTQAPTAIASDFYFFLFGIPLLLAISSVGQRHGGRALIWIDGLQVAFAIYLVHLQIFPGGPGSSARDAISAVRMTHAYNVENIALVVTAALRVLARPRGGERHLYRTLAAFLIVYALLAGMLNHLTMVYDLQTGSFYDLLWDLPFVVLVLLVSIAPKEKESAAGAEETWLELLVINASPVCFTMALLVMGLYVGRTHFRVGVAAVTFALITYGMRNSITQTLSMRMERRLLESEAALVLANQQLEQMSFLDRLTGVPNRRRFEDVLSLEWKRAYRSKLPLSLLVIDIDYFKLLNDRYGHRHGDDCLALTAQTLASCLNRAGELLARYGGEEFVAVLPSHTAETALVIAERMRGAIVDLLIPNENAPSGKMTVSIGVASTSITLAVDGNDLFELADKALYDAKREGRNQVRVAEESKFPWSEMSTLTLCDEGAT